jgi:argininosuccinate lyase
MWGGRFTEEPSALLRALNDSFAFDRELLAEDIEGSLAWAAELGRAGVLTADETAKLTTALRGLKDRVPRSLGSSVPRSGNETHDDNTEEPRNRGTEEPEGWEDVHSYVEEQLRASLGALAGKLHTGRSRNDQVATDLKLWLKRACDDAIALTKSLARSLAQKAVDEAATAMPGYTHLKQAEPITFGHWCLAHVEMLTRDLSRIEDARERGDECPLGSAALAGTPLAIDRERVAKSLGFARATRNSLDSVSDRDFAAEYLFAVSMLLSHLSRMAEDLIFLTSDEAAYAELPDSMATGSSRMPQKKNPDVLELARGHAARSIGELTGFLALLKGLPLGYNKDLQLDKEPLFRTRATLAALLPAMAAIVGGLTLNREVMAKAAGSPLLLATDAADALAATGIPFREAHEIVGKTFANQSQDDRATGRLDDCLKRKSALGGTSPERVREAALKALETLE